MTISSANWTLASVRERLCASFFVIMATDSKGGIKEKSPEGWCVMHVDSFLSWEKQQELGCRSFALCSRSKEA